MTFNDPTPETPLSRSDVKASVVPNKVIANPDTRRHWQDAINGALLLIAAWTAFFMFFPEVDLGPNDIEGRIADFVTLIITLGASTYGFTVTRPNIPKF
jgi:hypothetical protein